MLAVNISELKRNLSKYIRLLEEGDESEIIICRYNKMIAKISLYEDGLPRVGAGKKTLKDINFELKKGFENMPKSFGY